MNFLRGIETSSVRSPFQMGGAAKNPPDAADGSDLRDLQVTEATPASADSSQQPLEAAMGGGVLAATEGRN
jgi:hypothetical protein